MNRPSRRPRPTGRLAPQLAIPFPTKGAPQHDARAEVVVLLSRLLLQVASALAERQVDDEPS